jgi:hypothetical protein
VPRLLSRTLVMVSSLLLVVLLGESCALTNADLELTYVPSLARCRVAERDLQFVGIADARPEPGRIGVKKNGYGVDTASYYLAETQEGLPGWTKRAFVGELQSGGFEVSQGSLLLSGLPQISLTLRQFFVEPMPGTWLVEVHALVLLEVTVTMADGRQFARLFKGYHQTSGLLILDNQIREVLLTAAQLAVGKAAVGLCELLAGDGQS